MRGRRYEITKRLVFVFPLVYLLVVAATQIASEQEEIYPFFSWGLYSSVPAWVETLPAVVAHPTDDNRTRGDERWLIPSGDSRHLKALRQTLDVCEHRPENECLHAMERVLLPIVANLAGSRDVKFSLVWMTVDLRAVREGIGGLSAGRTQLPDYYRVAAVLSRWASGPGGLRRVAGAAP